MRKLPWFEVAFGARNRWARTLQGLGSFDVPWDAREARGVPWANFGGGGAPVRLLLGWLWLEAGLVLGWSQACPERLWPESAFVGGETLAGAQGRQVCSTGPLSDILFSWIVGR